MTTKLVLTYLAGLEVVHRAQPDGANGEAVDLACGPGHYTTCLARYLEYARVTGMDLSGPGVDTAAQNLPALGLQDRVQFQVQDITKLHDVETDKYQLASLTNAVHHLPDLETVSGVLRQMDRITHPNGLVMVMDQCRLRTAKLTEHYLRTFASDYAERGLDDLLEDFRNTMHAVWTPREFRQAIPRESARWWCHMVIRGLPMVQFAVGLPVGRKRVFARPGMSNEHNPLIREWYPRWQQEVSPQWAEETLKEWNLSRMTLLRLASKKMLPPGKQHATE